MSLPDLGETRYNVANCMHKLLGGYVHYNGYTWDMSDSGDTFIYALDLAAFTTALHSIYSTALYASTVDNYAEGEIARQIASGVNSAVSEWETAHPGEEMSEETRASIEEVVTTEVRSHKAEIVAVIESEYGDSIRAGIAAELTFLTDVTGYAIGCELRWDDNIQLLYVSAFNEKLQRLAATFGITLTHAGFQAGYFNIPELVFRDVLVDVPTGDNYVYPTFKDTAGDLINGKPLLDAVFTVVPTSLTSEGICPTEATTAEVEALFQ